MRTFIVWMAALSALGGGFAVCASAAQTGAAALDDQVTIAGETHDTPRVMVSGSGVPLRAALRQMVPPAYSINLPNAGAWAATPVTWSAGHSLSQTLRDMLSSHPELAAQVDTDFQLVTVRYRPPFGADTVGVAASSPAPAPSSSASPASLPYSASSSSSSSPALASRTSASAAAVEVGGPIGGNAVKPKALDAGPAVSAQTPADSGASPISMAPRLTSQPFVSAMAPATKAVHPATQAERANDSAVAVPAASGSARAAVANVPRAATTATATPVSVAANAPASMRANTAANTGANAAANTPATLPPATPEPAPPAVQTWNIMLSDRTVRGALTRWTQEAGWRLIWEAPVDFAVDAPATLTGTFDEALQSVVGALAGTESPVQAILYRGNKVLRIVEKGAG